MPLWLNFFSWGFDGTVDSSGDGKRSGRGAARVAASSASSDSKAQEEPLPPHDSFDIFRDLVN